MDTAKFLTPVIRFLRNQHSISKAGKIGGKYLSRKQVPDPKTGRMKWEYTYASKKDGNQVKPQDKPAENKNMKKPEIPERHYENLLLADQNIEYGDTKSEDKLISDLAKLSDKYDIQSFIKDSTKNGGVFADESALARLKNKVQIPDTSAKSTPPRQVSKEIYNMSNNVAYGDTANEDKIIDKVIELSNEYDMSRVIKELRVTGVLGKNAPFKRYKDKVIAMGRPDLLPKS